MDETEALARFDRAATAAAAVIDGVQPDRHAGPTPCTEWTVRDLMHHLVGGNVKFAELMAGTAGAGPADPTGDLLGTDPAEAFRTSTAKLREHFAAPGALRKPARTPFGEQPAIVLVQMRTVEMMTHGWDLAKATGQSTDLDPELAESLVGPFLAMREAAGGRRGMFDDVQPTPEGATPADRLAAAAGRTVTWTP